LQALVCGRAIFAVVARRSRLNKGVDARTRIGVARVFGALVPIAAIHGRLGEHATGTGEAHVVRAQVPVVTGQPLAPDADAEAARVIDGTGVAVVTRRRVELRGATPVPQAKVRGAQVPVIALVGHAHAYCKPTSIGVRAVIPVVTRCRVDLESAGAIAVAPVVGTRIVVGA